MGYLMHMMSYLDFSYKEVMNGSSWLLNTVRLKLNCLDCEMGVR